MSESRGWYSRGYLPHIDAATREEQGMVVERRIAIVSGSVLDQDVEAIVNAANTSMRGGSGLDGQVHRRAGDELLMELMRVAPHGCRPGHVVVTPGFGLRQKWVIHAVGPVWRGGSAGEAELLASCHRESLRVTSGLGIKTLAFCGISTGIYGYPADMAARIALRTAADWSHAEPLPERIVFALYREPEFQAFTDAARELGVSG